MLPVKKGEYVFPKYLRNYCCIFGPIGIVGMISFSILMWIVAATQTHSQLACGIVGVFFAVLALVFFISCANTSKLITMQYSIDICRIKNTASGHETCIDIDAPLFISKIILTFAVGKGCVKNGFLILSNKPFPTNILNMPVGTNAIKHIMQEGIIILPIDFCDYFGELHQRLNKANISQIPCVAYIPRSSL